MSRFIVLLAIVAAVVLATQLSGDTVEPRRYVVELDNAFGLVEGGDVRVAGANAGRVASLELDMKTKKALVGVEITEEGFGSFRSDVFCESRPQSPIGEYYLDCLPGTERRELPPGSRVPVKQTASTIPNDLVVNIQRYPYRERFRLIINEFGAGLAGRPQDLNDAIRRSVPALRQSAKLLAILADHNRVIRDLVTDADRVLKALADNRQNVGRFVVEARDTATASAERASDIALNFRKLPAFLAELRPTMAALGELADEQRPVLIDLDAASRNLREFFDLSADFARVSRPAIRSLGEAAVVGRAAALATRRNIIPELRRYARHNPELSRNLRIVLEDFDDPARAVERDPRSPGGRGYTGTQAVLQYIFNQALTNNGFDEQGHFNRAAIFVSDCGAYAGKERGNNPDLAHCRSWLGPNQPGITTPDPSAQDDPTRPGQQRRSADQGPAANATDRGPGAGAGPRDPGGGRRPRLPLVDDLPPLPGGIDGLLRDLLGDDRPLPLPPRSTGPGPFLDFLLGP